MFTTSLEGIPALGPLTGIASLCHVGTRTIFTLPQVACSWAPLALWPSVEAAGHPATRWEVGIDGDGSVHSQCPYLLRVQPAQPSVMPWLCLWPLPRSLTHLLVDGT